MSEIRWIVYGLAPIGEVCAPNAWTAQDVARRTYPGRVERVRSVASARVARERAVLPFERELPTARDESDDGR